jgi:hypothetical protein
MATLLTLNADLDQSGTGWHAIKTYCGPTIGWGIAYQKPSQLIAAAGTYQLDGSAGTILVNVAASVTIQLPSVAVYVQQALQRPEASFEKVIVIKDIGGNAALHPITITPFGTDKIDGFSSLTIIQNRAFTQLYPLSDLSGWFRAE